MAKDIKAIKPKFEFTGAVKEVKLEKTKNDKEFLQITLEDKDIKSEIKLPIWRGDTARYYSNLEKKTVEVTSDIEATMERVRKNGTGMPFGVKYKTPREETMFYRNNDLIDKLLQVGNGKATVSAKIVGDVKYSIYNGRVQRNYNISSIELMQKATPSFEIVYPAVISQDDKKSFFFLEGGMTTVPVLVKTALDNGSYGYRATKLALDQNYVIGASALKEVAKRDNTTVVEILNKKLMPTITKDLNLIEGYAVALIRGRLKTGQIVRECTEEDITPMELNILKMLGEDKVKEKLKSMPKIEEAFDDMLFVSFDIVEHKMFEPIKESELNLAVETEPTIASNPMLDTINSMLNQPSSAETDSNPFGDTTETEDKKEAKVEDLNVDEFNTPDDGVNEAEKNNAEFEDAFPF